MRCIKRYKRYQDEDFDRVLLYIKDGTIKCGKYSDIVKVEEFTKLKGGVLFEGHKSE